MGRKIKVDMTGVESYLKASEGIHVCRIASADVKQSQSGNDMIVVVYEVTKGEDKGARVYENYPLVETALWKLKGMLQAIGMKADGKVQLDLDKLVGKVLQVNVFHEEYEGQIRAKVESVMKLSKVSTDDEDDEDEDDDEDQEEEEKPAKKSKKPAINPPEEDEDDDEDWDDEDEEEEKPKKKAASKPEPKKPTKKPAKKQEEDDDDWDDDDWDED